MATRTASRSGRSRSRPQRGPQQTLLARARAKFLDFYPGGFRDASYVELERGYKWRAHEQWSQLLGKDEFRRLLDRREFGEIAHRAVRIESRTNLLFSFEKMALRDAVKEERGQRSFAEGLHALLYGPGSAASRFDAWVATLERLPRRQTRVLTWPLATVFGFVAKPERHIFLKPVVTRRAAAACGVHFHYVSRPNWGTYRELLEFAATVMQEMKDLKPRDLIDAQSFIWVQGSDEYA